jgi:geranylgeranyl diphosphate synthase, type II
MPLRSAPLHSAGELREAFDAYADGLAFAPELGGLENAVRYALEPGGKRIRPVLCLAVCEAAGGGVDEALPGAAAVELVHTFSLVHDDLPALDDDAVRRGRASLHVAFGEGIALLAGDALLAEAFRLALAYERPEPARELVEATLGMIGGQHRDVTGDDGDLAEVERLKTGRLFLASVGLGLWAAGIPAAEQGPWRVFGEELGLLFQVVDDILDGDGFAARLGGEEARRLADDAAERARARLEAISADTSVLRGLVDELAVRTS